MIKSNNHIMIDIEALDIRPTAAIAAVAAVAFDPESGEVAEKFYCRVDIGSSEKHGGTFGADTVKWWLRQPADARAELTCEEGETLTNAMANLNLFVLRQGAFGECIVWSKGTDYDFPILYHAMAQLGVRPAWNYLRVRDVRTLLEMIPVVGIDVGSAMPFNGTAHHALDDSLHQVKLVSLVWSELSSIGMGRV